MAYDPEDLVKLVRNPYPLPELSREGKWRAGGPILGEKVDPDDRRWYSKLNPCERLFAHHTLNTARRDCRYKCEEMPKSALDYTLSSVYAHSRDLFLPKSYVFIQPETINRETWRLLRNEIKVYSKPPVPLGHEIKYADIGWNSGSKGPNDKVRQRIHPSSLQLAIEGPHTDRTNPGFSRKIDGTYYGI